MSKRAKREVNAEEMALVLQVGIALTVIPGYLSIWGQWMTSVEVICLGSFVTKERFQENPLEKSI